MFPVGIGLYTPSEAALYARVHPSTVTRWVYGNRKGKAVITPQNARLEHRYVTFNDFVQVLAIRAIRQYFQVPLGRIREAVDTAKQDYGIDNLFARKVNCYAFDKEIFIELPSQEKITIQITGKNKGQLAMPEVAKLYSTRLAFSEKGLASRYIPFNLKHNLVVMDPAVRFGQPYAESSGHTISTLLNAINTEGDFESAVKVFGIGKNDFKLAVEYQKFLIGKNVA